jgi:predicted TIM-barrel fold metal-dependent hydrolase
LAPLTDPTRLKAYKNALANWNFNGYIQFELTETAYAWVKRELGNISLKEFRRLMHEYVAAGGEIDEVRETRPEWSDYEFHYDLRFTIQDKPVYIETRLNYKMPLLLDESTILVVSIHAP